MSLSRGLGDGASWDLDGRFGLCWPRRRCSSECAGQLQFVRIKIRAYGIIDVTW